MWRKTSTGLSGLYDAVNIKLDKAGGLTAALALHRRAREMGFGIMVVAWSARLWPCPALFLAQDRNMSTWTPVLLARDRQPGLVYHGSLSRRDAALWG